MKREEAARIRDGIYVIQETVAECCSTKRLARPGLSFGSLGAPSGAGLKQPGSRLNSEMEFGDVTFGVCIIYILYFFKK
jgi:hypothetical protein